MKKSRNNSEAYTWGDDCSGWHLVKSDGLSVIEELMPPNTKEVRHYHSCAQQYFYILKGEATFVINGETFTVPKREGIHIRPKTLHKIANQGKGNLEFLVISQPTTSGDRIDLEQQS
ncbi:cupin domain-containing protein [Flagellimonas sp.]|uniref:cupin domain-containing protein n=1 Tax=Flagellimonas sp. TaxID=2058762 RepID=UPI003AB51BC5